MTRTHRFSSFCRAVGLTVSTIFPLGSVSADGAPDLACSSSANIAKVTELIQKTLSGGNGGLKLAAALTAIRTTETTSRKTTCAAELQLDAVFPEHQEKIYETPTPEALANYHAAIKQCEAAKGELQKYESLVRNETTMADVLARERAARLQKRDPGQLSQDFVDKVCAKGVQVSCETAKKQWRDYNESEQRRQTPLQCGTVLGGPCARPDVEQACAEADPAHDPARSYHVEDIPASSAPYLTRSMGYTLERTDDGQVYVTIFD